MKVLLQNTIETQQLCNQVEKVLLADFGKSTYYPNYPTLMHFFPQKDLYSTTQILRSAKDIAIITGYYIKQVQSIETDGPLAAFLLAEFFHFKNQRCTIYTDEQCFPQLWKVNYDLQNRFQVKNIHQKMLWDDHDVCIVIERIGKTSDGHCYSLRGDPVEVENTTVYQFLHFCHKKKIPTIAVGDGGNEIGMGKYARLLEQQFQLRRLCVVPTDYFVFAGISNWISWAWIALLDRQYFIELPIEKEFQYLTILNQAKVVDGLTYQITPTVDGVSFEHQLQIRQKILTLTCELVNIS
ncbi:MAG: DUF4392 domain-containing protein [bacterium]|nr:DUF4392 domain-containing protein [bacterium]